MKQKLLILGPHYETFIKGSGEELAKYYDEINIIIPKFKKIKLFGKKLEIFKKVDRKFESNYKNVKIHEVPVSQFLPLASKQLLKYINKKKIIFDSVLSHFIIPYGYLGNKIAKKFQIKSFVVGHGYDVYNLPFKNLFFKKITKNILNNAYKIITVSKSNAECIEKLGFRKKTVVISNGFDNKLFKPMNKITCRKKLNLPNNKKIILSVGNLVEVKNHHLLMDSIKELTKSRQDVVCYIVGSGNLENNLKNKLKNDNLDNFIKFVGRVQHQNIPIWMNAVDLFVLPSKCESFGTVIIESLACGTPVVATITGGSQEIICNTTIGLLTKHKKKTLTNSIKIALNKKWNNSKIKRHANKYSWNKIIQKWRKLLK